MGGLEGIGVSQRLVGWRFVLGCVCLCDPGLFGCGCLRDAVWVYACVCVFLHVCIGFSMYHQSVSLPMACVMCFYVCELPSHLSQCVCIFVCLSLSQLLGVSLYEHFRRPC